MARPGAAVSAYLSTAGGRSELVARVRELSGGTVDAVLAVAGLASATGSTAAVNYFGTIATLECLNPLLANSPAPRAVAVSSMALFAVDDELLAPLTTGDEAASLARAAQLASDPQTGALIYATTKQALSRWIRRTAPSAEWAGASIALNAIAPGVVRTPMTAELTASEQGRRQLAQMVPMPLNGFFDARDAAELLVWLSSEANGHLCGQVISIDGGSDAVMRGDSVW